VSDLATSIRRRRLWQSRVLLRAYSLARRAFDAVGIQLVLKTYYSPIPEIRRLPPGLWNEPDPMRGIPFDLDAQVATLRELAAHLGEFSPQPGPHGYDPDNPSYPPVDARLLYAMIRHHRPRRVVELGSGHTSRVIAQACSANALEGHPAHFRAVDPYPIAVDDDLPGLEELSRVDVRHLPDEAITALSANDVLVVDTTHVVKLGSDVNYIVLRLLPLLAPGVLVHFHDIHLPYEYPRYFADMGLYWGEQYLLQAFLSMNPNYEVLCAVSALCRDRREAALSTGLAREDESGGAFWMRRIG
jgi:hypothetical protein